MLHLRHLRKGRLNRLRDEPGCLRGEHADKSHLSEILSAAPDARALYANQCCDMSTPFTSRSTPIWAQDLGERGNLKMQQASHDDTLDTCSSSAPSSLSASLWGVMLVSHIMHLHVLNFEFRRSDGANDPCRILNRPCGTTAALRRSTPRNKFGSRLCTRRGRAHSRSNGCQDRPVTVVQAVARDMGCVAEMPTMLAECHLRVPRALASHIRRRSRCLVL